MRKGSAMTAPQRESEKLPTLTIEDLPAYLQRHAFNELLREDFRAFVR